MSNVTQAKAVIQNAFGSTLTNEQLLRVADAFVIARSDLIPTEIVVSVDPETGVEIESEVQVEVTAEVKAGVVNEAVKRLMLQTVGGVAVKSVAADNVSILEAAQESARVTAIADLG